MCTATPVHATVPPYTTMRLYTRAPNVPANTMIFCEASLCGSDYGSPQGSSFVPAHSSSTSSSSPPAFLLLPL
eukprot:1796683-Pyramimonas_sp.AAC.1